MRKITPKKEENYAKISEKVFGEGGTLEEFLIEAKLTKFEHASRLAVDLKYRKIIEKGNMLAKVYWEKRARDVSFSDQGAAKIIITKLESLKKEEEKMSPANDIECIRIEFVKAHRKDANTGNI